MAGQIIKRGDKKWLVRIFQGRDENGKLTERVFLKLHPRLAPFKAAVFPLVNKDGMPEVAQKLYRELKRRGRVRHVDEFRTSVVCSLCDEQMDGRSRFWALKVCKNTCLVSISLFFCLSSRLPNYMFIYINRHSGTAT